MKPWTVLVVGAGAREHALARRLGDCERVGRVVLAPGNGGTQRIAPSPADPTEIEALAIALRPELVVIGPEQPLCDGLTDRLESSGLTVYGPSRAAAKLEASKAFMKDFAQRHGIRSAEHVTVSSLSELERGLAEFPSPPVVKATGLCAGKGVVVAESFDEAREAAAGMLSGEAFGEAGHQVVLEERLYGQEVSVHAVCDGQRAFVLPPIQDHKRIGEADTGPNTGGMGTYGPAPVVDDALAREIESRMVLPVVDGMRRDGTPFRGTLFANVMVTPERQPLLLEINVRFGDPETQVLMSLIDGDFAGLLHSAARSELDPSQVMIGRRHGICVVLAAAGYPGAPRKGDLISGIEQAEELEGVRVYHAGTALRDGQLVTAGGRVLSVTATGDTLNEAHRLAYDGVSRIRFEGAQFRRDIGHLALGA